MSKVENDEGDLTRKQRREQARAQRKAAEEAAAAGDARRRRLTQLGGAVVVVVVAIIVILVATGGGGKGKPPPKVGTGGAEKIAAEVRTELNGIPQKGNVLGKETAPVTLAYFGDLQCPFCREFTEEALPKLVQNDVRSGKLRVEYRNMETATREPEVFRTQQTAALAAGKQNKGWYYIELFYHLQQQENSGYVNESFLQKLAELTPGLNLGKWQSDRSGSALQEKLAEDSQAANNAGFTGTPSFLIGRTGSTLKKFETTSVTEPSGFEQEVEKLAKA